MEQGWTFAGLWEAIADAYPEYTAQVQGRRRFLWSEFDRRADGIAAVLLDAGLGLQSKVAQYLHNCPEYLESMFGVFKAGLVPVNTNYRYNDDELLYLWRDADVEAVVFDSSFSDTCERLRHRLPGVKCWIQVSQPAETAGEPQPWALDYEAAARSGHGRVEASWGRSGSNLYLLYTGGTTGMPKGVMWQQDTLFRYLESVTRRGDPGGKDLAEYVAEIAKPGPIVLPAPPLMHGAGAWFAMSALCRAASVVTLVERRLDPIRLLDTLGHEAVNGLALVGDPFGRPLADALDAEPNRWDLSPLRIIMSAGTVLSPRTKERLRKHARNVLIIDALGSSETGAIAQSKSGSGGHSRDASFTLKPGSRVIGADGTEVVPGSGQPGRLAVSGYVPLGYYKDAVKSAQSFVAIEDLTYAFTGDWVLVAEDGVTIKLLGRGSQCINTGGEKVFAEEVEEAIRAHPQVSDVVVVGIPDGRYGEAVVAVVQSEPSEVLTEAVVIAHVREKLAGYKTPKHVVLVDDLARAGNGKADPMAIRELAVKRLRGPKEQEQVLTSRAENA